MRWIDTSLFVKLFLKISFGILIARTSKLYRLRDFEVSTLDNLR